MADASDYAVIICLAAASILSSIGSLLIIATAVINKKLRGFTSVLIINQATADLLLSAISIPLRTLRIATKADLLESKIISSKTYCQCTTFLSIVLFGASVFSLFLLTLDRFLGIRFPLQYRIKASSKYFRASIALSWLIPFIIGFLPMFVTQLQSELDLGSSDTACIYGTVIILDYMIFVNISTLILPLVIMILMYLSILHKVHKSWSAVTRRDLKRNNGIRRASVVDPSVFKKKEVKLARGVFCILFIHLICLMPIVVIDWLQTFSGVLSPPSLIKTCLVLTYSNAVIDPVIYAAFSREYKNTFWRLLTCKTRSDQRRVITSADPHVNDNIARIYTEEIPLNDVVNAGFVLPSNIAMRDNYT